MADVLEEIHAIERKVHELKRELIPLAPEFPEAMRALGWLNDILYSLRKVKEELGPILGKILRGSLMNLLEEPFFQTGLGVLYCGDSLEILHKIPGESVDLILTDPPYGVTDEEWDEEVKKNYKRFTKRWLSEAYRVLKEGGQIYVFSPQKRMFEFKELLEGAGFKLLRALIWHHPNMIGKFTSKSYIWTYDPIFYAVKGEKPRVFHSSFTRRENVDVFKFALPQRNFKNEDRRVHPFQKPLKLCEILIKNSSDPGDLVLDPFAGSGTTLLAAEKLGRRWIGIEISPEYCQIALKRFLP